MKLSILAAALLAVSASTVSAAPANSLSGTVYVYVNSIPHPKTTFLKTGSNNQLVTDGVACKNATTLPGTGDALSGTFTTVKNQWDFNGQHDNEINMGYVKINGGNNCLSLTKGNALTAAPCPSFNDEIKVGNKFAWFHDKRNSAIWAYGGDANATESNGLTFDATNLQTTGKTLTGIGMNDDPLNNVFIGLGHVSLGHASKNPTGCQ
ncbi:uncharacterized protein BX664DRAFT_343189 [Halteromyces radiatus]|uniref:uncharacterized protein n=1 Tax=Halteromyces radiatus TaxID=101107 RepID=UPI0022210CB1|nr:uncharacterized protein BX664DRAFT_343189 [Halteromyces radiatus]KAI8077672.1 hypothetical protein BX664DRAFT_343189 [Halteromyces radiatus]